MCKLCLCAVLIFTPIFSFSATLPSGYTQLEYIESTGTRYIEDNLSLITTGTIEAKIAVTGVVRFLGWGSLTDGGNMDLVLATGSATPNYVYTWLYNDFPFEGSKQQPYIKPEIMNIIRLEFSPAQRKFYVNGELNKENNTEKTITDHGYKFRLFRANYSYTGTSRISYCKIWNENGTLIRQYIPAKRNLDNVLGMYDTVTNTFFTNKGTGSFIAGPVVDTCENPLTIMGTEICAENTQPSGTYLVARQNGNKYYINLSEEENPNNPKPITNESNNVLRIKIGNTIYNAHDSSVSE